MRGWSNYSTRCVSYLIASSLDLIPGLIDLGLIWFRTKLIPAPLRLLFLLDVHVCLGGRDDLFGLGRRYIVVVIEFHVEGRAALCF